VDLPRQRAEVGDLTRDINVALVVELVLTREHWWPSETDSSPFAASRSLLLDESVRIVRYGDRIQMLSGTEYATDGMRQEPVAEAADNRVGIASCF